MTEFLPKRDQNGFTLVELVIVIVILGVLAGLVVFAVSGLASNSAQSACKADYKTVEVAAETYKAQLGSYPSPTVSGDTLSSTADAVPLLLAPDTVVTPSVGPWLHDQPTNGHHYRIEVTNDGSGTIQVYDYTGATKYGGTGTITDCSNPSVK